ncbi:hypothetical protein [Actinomadura soli]|nr:hypothetical protein [Actinomadura soli]
MENGLSGVNAGWREGGAWKNVDRVTSAFGVALTPDVGGAKTGFSH